MLRVRSIAGTCCALLTVALLAAPPVRAQGAADLNAREKTEVFIQHLVKVSRIDPAEYQALVLEYEVGVALEELLHQHQEGEEHDHEAAPGENPVGFTIDGFLERALEEIHPAYARLVAQLEARELDKARQAGRELAGSADPYVAAHASLALAEIGFLDAGADGAAAPEDGEEAYKKVIRACERILEKERLYLIRDYRACELIAMCFEKLDLPLLEFVQYAILLTDYKDIPPQVQGRVRGRLALLNEKAGRPLGTVANWMNEVEKLLAKEVTKKNPTQRKETEIVYALDKLIELQEARERNACPNCGSGSCKGGCRSGRPKGSRSERPAQVSALAEAKGEFLLRGVSRGDSSTIWGLLKERDASRALQGFKGKLPPRYERLLEQYYKNLSTTE